eukprot:CAMPEP_0119546992 /NCGR_PEP_ID=MMETSP1352-20130426/1215_1 /TAXON_ID=265584 /ORGANISM="Stauroneis constricta, Strain CCMP1120" /LENGTH=350 /DNA_ID=CAMNT_0007591785 /DNA_START=67 /DNA_END=1119 /DNA_ORIENTATION=+
MTCETVMMSFTSPQQQQQRSSLDDMNHELDMAEAELLRQLLGDQFGNSAVVDDDNGHDNEHSSSRLSEEDEVFMIDSLSTSHTMACLNQMINGSDNNDPEANRVTPTNDLLTRSIHHLQQRQEQSYHHPSPSAHGEDDMPNAVFSLRSAKSDTSFVKEQHQRLSRGNNYGNSQHDLSSCFTSKPAMVSSTSRRSSFGCGYLSNSQLRNMELVAMKNAANSFHSSISTAETKCQSLDDSGFQSYFENSLRQEQHDVMMMQQQLQQQQQQQQQERPCRSMDDSFLLDYQHAGNSINQQQQQQQQHYDSCQIRRCNSDDCLPLPPTAQQDHDEFHMSFLPTEEDDACNNNGCQ